MRTTVRRLGNSAGVIIPKSVLAETGVGSGDAVDLTIDEGRILLSPVRRHPREGWEESARAVAEAGDDGLVWPEFGHAGDADLVW